MKLVLGVVILYLWFIGIIDSKMVRLLLNDEIYPYTIDRSVPLFTEYFSIKDLLLEQIDDENVKAGGHVTFVKSMNPRMPVQFDFKTRYFQNSVWNDALFRLTLPNICPDFSNPDRFWFNISKLWDQCPPQKGDKWVIEQQTIDIKMEFPPTVPSGSWQAFIMYYQLGTTYKFGLMMQAEVIEIV